MDAPLIGRASDRQHRVVVLLACAAQRLEWHGMVGVVLLVAALAVAWSTWSASSLPASVPGLPLSSSLGSKPVSAWAMPVPVRLPPQSDIPLLLSRIERSAVEQGLGWPRADYRVIAATEDMPATLDVRVTLDGPYLNVRRFVSSLLLDAPTLTLREFSLSRPNPDAPNVEARLAIVVFLASADVTR